MLGLTPALLPLVHSRGQNREAAQEGDRVIERVKHFNPPAEISLVKSRIGTIELDKKFSAGEDWFEGLAVGVHNKSEKPISYISLHLYFPRPKEQQGMNDLGFSLQYGVNPIWARRNGIAMPAAAPIQPGNKVEITLPDNRYRAIQAALVEAGYPASIKTIKIYVEMLGFSDGTIWLGNKMFTQDENEPGRLISLEKKTLPVTESFMSKVAYKVTSTAAQSDSKCGDVKASDFIACSNGFNCSVPTYTLHPPPGENILVKEDRICMTGYEGECEPIERKASVRLDPCPTPTPSPTPSPTPTPTPTPTPQTREACIAINWYWNLTTGTCSETQCAPRTCSPQTYWDSDWCRCVNLDSPVLVDVNGDGFALTDAAGGVRFDLDADGAAERLAWLAAGADDAWLALDRDGNGVIGDGRELFGNHTPQPAPPAGQEKNGFLALAEYDQPTQGGNGDGVIDAHDAVFASLRLWRDANHNGLSEPGELRGLADLGLKSIDLDYKESKRTDEHGNRFRYRAKVWDARGAQVARWAWDVFLIRGQ
jgi:hypothetical protein